MNVSINVAARGKGNFYHYIAVKFAEGFTMPGSESKEAGHPADDSARVRQQAIKQFPGLYIKKMFTSLPAARITELIARAVKSDPLYRPENLLSYYLVLCPTGIEPGDVIQFFLQSGHVELAYLQGRKIAASVLMEKEVLPSAHYLYLNAAPAGINVKYAWTVKGGKGKGTVRFIDIEQGWDTGHEYVNIKTLPLSGTSNELFKHHGTAAFGIILMKENEDGAGGIVPEATGYAVSQWRPDGLSNEADAILTAISYLGYGDIILIESQAFHPDTKNKLWPVETQETIFRVIRLATALGIIVIEAAGNGDLFSVAGNDLDLFSSGGKYILHPESNDFRDSGAVLVAAAFQSLPHKKIPRSNYGGRVNCYASGEPAGVFAKKINATSAASAIITGAALAIQSICEAIYGTRLGPSQMRTALSNEQYGTPSANGHSTDKIGVMPDLEKIIDDYLPSCFDKN